ncbi:alpha/beta fold hydrolase [Klebsiella michiganensis]|nr:alpha/beta fold hydrolase [Klebsiella michiganensis]UIU18045.1 alpha/beta fold hydrolase [Klebsiella michiganensis]
MWSEIAPDRCHNIAVEGYNVVAYQFGDGDETILCLNGGPGLPCDYLREAHACLKQHGYRVIAFDQLGTGKSDRPDDASLWTMARYVREVETVRRTLGLGQVHLLGHSWGGWLAIEVALHRFFRPTAPYGSAVPDRGAGAVGGIDSQPARQPADGDE